MSRTALNGFPFGDVEKDELIKIIKKFSNLFFVEVFGFLFTLLNSSRIYVLHIRVAKRKGRSVLRGFYKKPRAKI